MKYKTLLQHMDRKDILRIEFIGDKEEIVISREGNWLDSAERWNNIDRLMHEKGTRNDEIWEAIKTHEGVGCDDDMSSWVLINRSFFNGGGFDDMFYAVHCNFKAKGNIRKEPKQ